MTVENSDGIEYVPLKNGFVAIYETSEAQEENEEGNREATPSSPSFPIPRNVKKWFSKDEQS